jgi:hypothetical protein
MPSWRNKPANRQYLNKRYTPEQQHAMDKAARAAVQRLYCDVLETWRACQTPRCKRHRRCAGDPQACLRRGVKGVPQHRLNDAEAEVLAGGPRRVAPATHTEWVLRRWPLSSLA